MHFQTYFEVAVVLYVHESYVWVRERLRIRSPTRTLPRGLPENHTEVATHVSRKGNGAFFRFSLSGTLDDATDGMPAVVRIDCEDGYANFGMPDTHTIGTLASEFTSLTSRGESCHYHAPAEIIMDG
jgi:hypothetical protein